MQVILALWLFCLTATAAHAYVGPGLGLGALAVVAGIVMSVFLAIVSVVWYPVKRLLRKDAKRTSRERERRSQAEETGETTPDA